MANTSQPLATPSYPPSLHFRWSLTPLFLPFGPAKQSAWPLSCSLLPPFHQLRMSGFLGSLPEDPQCAASLCLHLSSPPKTMSPT